VILEFIRIKDLPDWALMDPDKDGYEGTRTESLFQYLQTMDIEQEPDSVIVAVMDTGIDIEHPSLKNNIWQNDKEIDGIPEVDDDDNGYVDDFYGWNYLGNSRVLSLEVTREMVRLKKESVSPSDSYYKKVEDELEERKHEEEDYYKMIKSTVKEVKDAEEILKIKDYPTDPHGLKKIKSRLRGRYLDAANLILGINIWFGLTVEELVEEEKNAKLKFEALFNPIETHLLIGDNPNILLEKNYGNNNITTTYELHGTHVAGIIAADKKGIGQAPFARIMCLRTTPDEGDERDKDVGNAIRYAVDNGASIINMSAGKYFSLNPDFVIDALKYAEDNGVLFVVSAGNEGFNIEQIVNYPPKFYEENGEMKYFSNVLVVSANSWMKKWSSKMDPDDLNLGYDLAASFSNYSNSVVDLFAPGVEINSTVPGGRYERTSGTSMASPEASGVAAIIKGFFPQLTAREIKIILTSSVRKYEGLRVRVKGRNQRVLFSSLSKSGGVIDAFNAYLLADEKYRR
jgi:subtilisin family serine protease